PREKQLIEAAFYRGQLYSELGDVQKALADFNDVVAQSPGFLRVYPLRAQVRISLGDNDGALKDIDAYLAEGQRLDQTGWITHGRRGRVLRVLHSQLTLEQRAQGWGKAMASLALAELLQAVKLGGRAEALFDDVGAMLEHTGQLRDAILAYTKGLELAP